MGSTAAQAWLPVRAPGARALIGLWWVQASRRLGQRPGRQLAASHQ